jgi:hypothetical protein
MDVTGEHKYNTETGRVNGLERKRVPDEVA